MLLTGVLHLLLWRIGWLLVLLLWLLELLLVLLLRLVLRLLLELLLLRCRLGGCPKDAEGIIRRNFSDRRLSLLICVETTGKCV